MHKITVAVPQGDRLEGVPLRNGSQYEKWGGRVAKRLVKMLKDETERARDVLERLKRTSKSPKRR